MQQFVGSNAANCAGTVGLSFEGEGQFPRVASALKEVELDPFVQSCMATLPPLAELCTLTSCREQRGLAVVRVVRCLSEGRKRCGVILLAGKITQEK